MRKTAWLVALALGVTACGGSDDPPQAQPLAANALYLFAITSAQVKSTNNGSNWDGDSSAPDVFVRFSDGVSTVDSGTVLDSYNPTWTTSNAVAVTVATLRSGNFTVQVFDEDVAVDDAVTNAGVVTLTDAQIRAGTLTFTNWDGANSVTFAVAPSP